MSEKLTTVYLVDDEPNIRAIAELSLQDIGGYEVTLFESGKLLLEHLKSGCIPQLLLLDVMMPNMDGPETLRTMREISGCWQLPIIFLTAKTQPHEVESFLELGAAGVIAKPFDPMALATEVESIWNKL